MTATARRATLLSIVVVLSIGVASGYTWYALQRTTGHPQPAAAAQADADSSAAGVLRHPHIVFQNTKTGPTYGKVAAVALRAPGGRRTLTTTSCDRVYSVGVAGLCLTTDRGVVTKHRAHVLDAALRPGPALPTGGEPSRVRLAANGRLGATTTFSAGHSYLSSSFSTATTIYDVKRAKALHNVEEFAITRNGMPYQAVDVNVWGVTFKRDGDGFYATMASKGTIHLVEGSVRSRTLRTLKEGVECPSLSPNGKRVAYKMRDDSPGFSGWRVHVLDLETGSDYALPGDRSVDDQVEWLDDGHVLYGLIRQVGYLESDVWMAPADASSAPKVLIREAWSPAVVRDPAP